MKICRCAILVAVAFVLTGCTISLVSTDGQLTLGVEEKWSLNIDLVLTGENYQLYGSLLNEQFKKTVQNLAADQIDAEFGCSDADSSGNITCRFEMRGQGFDSFNRSFGGNDTIVTYDEGGKKFIQVSMNNIAEGMFVENGSTFRIKGGRIQESNGNQINTTTVEWVNPGRMTVVMEQPSTGNLLGIIMILLGAACILFAVGWQLGWLHKLRPQQVVIEPMTVKNETNISSWNESGTGESFMPENSTEFSFCPNCGTQLALQARFCTTCGFKLKA